jgi:NAD(P)-dependent dehydrogenase (short-subunit alcohol dehydrogenase family)
MSAYTASKHAVLGITKSAAADVARGGVRVNAICPGPVETRMMRSLEAQRNPADPEGAHTLYAANIPLGRYATAEEIANSVIYLCSDLAGSVTGTQLLVDGGRIGSGSAAPVPRIKKGDQA